MDKNEYKPLRQAFFAITCSYEIMNSVTIVTYDCCYFYIRIKMENETHKEEIR